MTDRFVFRHAPMLAFTLVYVGTCLIGAVFLLLGWRPFLALFEYFSGTAAPNLTGTELAKVLVLLLAAPAVMWLGYAIALRVPLGPLRLTRAPAPDRLDPPRWLPHAIFYPLALAAFVSVARAGAFGNLDAWRNYNAWINAREELFRHIGFAGYVNIYTLVPLAAAWIVLTTRPTRRGLALAVPPIVLAVVLQLLLFQKKAALVALLIVFAAWVIERAHAEAPRWLRWVVPAGVLAIAAVYFALVVVPVYSRASNAVQQSLKLQHQKSTLATGVRQRQVRRLRQLADKVRPAAGGRSEAIALYSLLSPLTRTSAPALYYPVVFPRSHPYYGLGIGNGAMADDNRVVWDYMNPKLPGGTATAPFQFVFYALLGLAGALVGSFLAGAGLGAVWRLVASGWLPAAWCGLVGTLAVLLGIYLAIDSAENSIVVSYGVIWGFLFVAAAAAFVYALRRLPLRLHADEPAEA